MSKNYALKLLKKSRQISNDRLTVGCVLDKQTNKPILILDVVKDFLKITKNKIAIVGEFEADHCPGEYYGLVEMDAKTFVEDIFNDRKLGEVTLMHELGHYVNGDLKPGGFPDNYSSIRAKYDGVMPQEYKADEFAIRECGIEKFLYFIKKITTKRSEMTWDKNREKAIREFELRKEHAIEYANTLSLN